MKCTYNLLFYFFFAIIFISPTHMYAQEKKLDHSLQPGSQALQFQITDDIILESFSGSVLSYKWQNSKSKAYRVGISFNGNYTTQDREHGAEERSDTRLGINLGLNFSWMNYLNPEDDVKFYYGYGPQVFMGYDHIEDEDENFGDDVTKATLFGAAAFGYAGLEWFFQQSMSIHAEYQASAQFIYRTQRNESRDLQNTARSFRLGGDGVKLGLSIYF